MNDSFNTSEEDSSSSDKEQRKNYLQINLNGNLEKTDEEDNEIEEDSDSRNSDTTNLTLKQGLEEKKIETNINSVPTTNLVTELFNQKEICKDQSEKNDETQNITERTNTFDLKSDSLLSAEETFKDILGAIKNDSDVLAFVDFVEKTLVSNYGLSIFGSPVPNYKSFRIQRGCNSDFSSPKGKGKCDIKLKRSTTKYDKLVTSPDSLLVGLNMKDIINIKTFNLLTPEEKDSLLEYLPPTDKDSLNSLENLLACSTFNLHLNDFQTSLEMGEFDPSNDDYRSYLRGKKKREQLELDDTWKSKYFEEYWGQLKLKQDEETKQEESLPVISFVQLENSGLIEKSCSTHPKNLTKNQKDLLISSEDDLDDFIIDEITEEPKKKRKKTYENYEEEDTLYKPKIRKEKKKRDTDSEIEEKKEKRKKKESSEGGSNSFRHCAYTILKRAGKPLNAAEIVKVGIKEGMISTSGKTPQNTLASVIYCEIKKDPNCCFVKIAPMTFGLKEFDYMNTKQDVPYKAKTKRRKKKNIEENKSDMSSTVPGVVQPPLISAQQ